MLDFNAAVIIKLILDSLGHAYVTLESFFFQTGMAGIYSAMMLIFVVCRFILAPIVGATLSPGSDTARKDDDRTSKSTSTRVYPRDNSRSKSGG